MTISCSNPCHGQELCVYIRQRDKGRNNRGRQENDFFLFSLIATSSCLEWDGVGKYKGSGQIYRYDTVRKTVNRELLAIRLIPVKGTRRRQLITVHGNTVAKGMLTMFIS